MKRSALSRGKPLRRRSRLSTTRRGPHADWWKVKQWVLGRDGGRCQAGALSHDCTGQAVHVHHVKPRGRGGSDDPSNLIGVCAVGHLAIHEHPEEAHGLGLLTHSWEDAS